MKKEYSLDKEKIKVVLLEGIHKSATDFFRANGYTNIESFSDAPDEALLLEKIKSANIIGIRSGHS